MKKTTKTEPKKEPKKTTITNLELLKAINVLNQSVEYLSDQSTRRLLGDHDTNALIRKMNETIDRSWTDTSGRLADTKLELSDRISEVALWWSGMVFLSGATIGTFIGLLAS